MTSQLQLSAFSTLNFRCNITLRMKQRRTTTGASHKTMSAKKKQTTDQPELPELTDEGLELAKKIAIAARGGDNQAVFQLAKKLATEIDE